MASASPAPSISFVDNLHDSFANAAYYSTLACYGVFCFLIGLDGWRAFKKGATWLPGKAFALSGLTVQIIAWWTSVSHINNKCEANVNELLRSNQLVVSGRVAVCVFIGYLLPGMAAPDLQTFAALALTICAQIGSELLSFHANKGINAPKRNWAALVDKIIFICIIVLGLLLICTVLASKSIQGFLRQRISEFFSITKTDEFQSSNERTMPISWYDFEDEVIRSWFVARACQIDYVISRSVLSSAVGIVVTICVILSVLSNTSHNVYISKGKDAIFFPLFSFIVIGWLVICWRWLVAQLYFHPRRCSWRRYLCPEDFWTRNIVELIHMYDIKKDRQRLQDYPRSIGLERLSSEMPWLNKLQRLPTKIFTKLRLHKLLYLVLMLQVTVVFFSKLCGLLSEVILSRFVYWCRKHMWKEESVASRANYARILECVCLPGEKPFHLWEANKMSFTKVKFLMQKGCEKGRSSEGMNSIFHLYSSQWAKDGARLLNMLERIPSVLIRGPTIEKQYMKMTIVQLIIIYMRLPKAKSDRLRKVMTACHEIWDLLTFAEEGDINLQANQISILDDLNKDKDQVCMAAEREFHKLQLNYDKLSSGCENEDCVIDIESPHRFLTCLLEKSESFLKKGECKEVAADFSDFVADFSDSKDWMKIAPIYMRNKLCTVMLDKDEDIKDFVTWTEESLRNVIACCVSRLPDMLVKQCWKWAQEFEEDKLWEAIYLAGKCKGLMEGWTRDIDNTLMDDPSR